MYRFRVSMCQKYEKNMCRLGRSCFDAHDEKMLRRDPRKFHYFPRLCRNLLEDAKEGDAGVCSKGQECDFAHNSLEICFHPIIFKTQLCPHMDIREQKKESVYCSMQGPYCSRAHGKTDLRTSTPKNPTTMQKQFSETEILLHYKVNECVGTCHCFGFRYHSESERRRPLCTGYSPQRCPNMLTANGEWLEEGEAVEVGVEYEGEAGSLCVEDCKLAHTRVEAMYHPANFRTRLCDRFEKSGDDRCRFGSLCAHAHGKKQLRAPKKNTQARRKH